MSPSSTEAGSWLARGVGSSSSTAAPTAQRGLILNTPTGDSERPVAPRRATVIGLYEALESPEPARLYGQGGAGQGPNRSRWAASLSPISIPAGKYSFQRRVTVAAVSSSVRSSRGNPGLRR